jgi:type I restriction enzyme S subunit
MSPECVRYVAGEFFLNDSGLTISPKTSELSQGFIDKWLFANTKRIFALGRGSAQKNLDVDALRKFPISFPSAQEQERIVAVLDRAFQGIGIAKANAEKSLEISSTLFSSYLDHLKGPKQSLGSLVTVKTGKLDSNAAVEDGIYPFFTCSRDTYAINAFAFDCHAILLAGNNAVGDFNVKIYNGKFNAYQRTYVITIPDEKKLSHRYLYYQILKSMKELKQKSVGAGTKFLKLGMINGLEIVHPSISVQESIVDSLDNLLQETQRLESVLRQKLSSLDELRQSLLHLAFSGNL